MHTDVTALLFESATLLVVGMLVVFLFLSLLIGAVTGIAWLCAKFPLEDEISPVAYVANRGAAAPQQEGIPQPVIAAIAGAIKQYRRQG